MEIKILPYIPEEWKRRKPLEDYDTTLLYTGFSRYNTKTKMLSQILRDDTTGSLTYTESPCDSEVLSRCYSSESARIIVYSTSPAVWVEILSPIELYFIQQQRTA
jgi:hypothetical protein